MTVTCCEPFMDYGWPSGPHPTHARSCPVSPGAKVKQADHSLIPINDEAASRLAHPAGTAEPRIIHWLRRPDCGCAEICAYFDHWTDDDDDRTFEVAR